MRLLRDTVNTRRNGSQKYQFTSGVGKKGSAVGGIWWTDGGCRGTEPAGRGGGGARSASGAAFKATEEVAPELGPGGAGMGGGVSFERTRRVG